MRYRTSILITICFLLALTTHAQLSIATIKSMPAGSVVETTGTIISGDEWGQIRFLQDETAGIGLFSNSLSALQPGDSIIVRGVVSKYRGQVQLSPVLSHTVIATSGLIKLHEIENFTSPSLVAHNSQFVSIACAGIHTIEPDFEDGTYSIYDQYGNSITAVIHELSGLLSKPIITSPVTITGILSGLDGQQRMLIDTIEFATHSCHIIEPGIVELDSQYFYTYWLEPPYDSTFVQWGIDTFIRYLEIPDPPASVVAYPYNVDTGTIYQIRLEQVDSDTDTFFAKPVYFTPPSTGDPVEFYFNKSLATAFSDGSAPAGVGALVIEDALIDRIDATTQTLEVAMYNTGRDPIVAAINRAVQRGVAVRFVADDETSNAALVNANFPVHYRTNDGIMHNKFVIGDAQDSLHAWLWAGSTNLTSNQLTADPNHAYIIPDQSLAQNYLREFEEMWGTTPNHSDGASGETKDDNTCHQFNYNKIWIESYFSPSDETEQHIIESIRYTQHQLLLGLLLLTSEDLLSVIIDRWQQGVDVRVILEDEESSAWAISQLLQAGVPYAIHDPSTIYHHKVAIVDEGHPYPLVVSGSHNWTWSADHINDENTLIFHDQGVANIFRQEFEARWAELDPVGISHAVESALRAYPNPASNNIAIENPTGHDMNYQLVDFSGHIYMVGVLAASKQESISIPSRLTNGLYTIRLTNGHQHIQKTIMILR